MTRHPPRYLKVVILRMSGYIRWRVMQLESVRAEGRATVQSEARKLSWEAMDRIKKEDVEKFAQPRPAAVSPWRLFVKPQPKREDYDTR